MHKKTIDWIKLEDKKPEVHENILGLTSVGSMQGFYLKADIFQTRTGLYNFTKWVPDETK